MRTKALLGLAALAVSAITAVAQSNVYSLNIVGYVNVPMLSGNYTYVNPLDKDGTNNADVVLALPPATSFAFWTGSAFDSWYYEDVGDPTGNKWWTDNTASTPKAPPLLPVGKGFYVNPPFPFTNTFVGNVVPNPGATNSLTIPSGNQLVGSPMPVGGSISNAVLQLALPPATALSVWTGGAFINYYFEDVGDPSGNVWWTDNTASTPAIPPVLDVGRSLYINPPFPFDWKQKLP